MNQQLLKTIKEADCPASLNRGILTLEDGTQVDLASLVTLKQAIDQWFAAYKTNVQPLFDEAAIADEEDAGAQQCWQEADEAKLDALEHLFCIAEPEEEN